MNEAIAVTPLPDLRAKLAFLNQPETYGDSQQPVECLETHMSWLFLVGQKVFKLKKPVCASFLDFTTLKAREFSCREEVRLNARLAPGVYLGLLALKWHNGDFHLVPEEKLPAPGVTVDWLVLMRRLPQQRMLHHLMSSRSIDATDMDALVAVLGKFYRTAPIAHLSENDYLARFQCEHARNREVLLRPEFRLQNSALAVKRLGEALALCSDLLRGRVMSHHVVYGHGDLRPDHVCLLQPPVVIDCREFNALLQQVDPLDEIAGLGLECEMAGTPWIGPHLATGIANALDDHPSMALLHFYTAHRALLRARLAMAHLLDPQARSPAKWPPLAESYLARSLVATEALTSSL